MRLPGPRRGTPRELARLGPQLRSVTDSLLLSAGALQLLPDNATKWLRFARLVEATRAVRPALPQRPAAVADLEALLTGPPIASDHVLDHEDPFEGPFTAPVLFDDTEYLTVPGAIADAATVCQFLLGALDALPTEARTARELMCRDAVRLLWISDTVARRGGLERWQAPTYEKGRSVHIPAEEDRQRLEAAVYFDDSDLEHQFGGIESFTDLCWPERWTRWRRDRACLTDDRALVYPLSRASSSNGLIVPSPNQLALSVVHRVAARAVANGAHHHLMSAFERAVLADAERICRQMSWTPLGSSLTLAPFGNIQDAVFAFDADKFAHVVVFADDLHGYETARPLAATDSTTRMQSIGKRMKQVRDAVASLDPEGEVLHLVLTVPIGRSMHADPISFVGAGWSILMLSIDELRTIADHERDDELGLWRFARVLHELPLPGYPAATKAVDAYALYLSSGKVPLRLGGRKRPVVLMLLGDGAPLVVDQRRRSDVHAAQLPDSPQAVLVGREAVSDSSRVYKPQPEELSHLRLVELAVPCWVGANGTGAQSHRNCSMVADAVVHHLWRIRDIVHTYLSEIADHTSRVAINIVDPDGSSLTFAVVDEAVDTPWFATTVDHDEYRITVRLQPSAAVRLSQDAARAEHTLVAALVRALASLTRQPPSNVSNDLTDIAARETPRFMYVVTGYVPGVHGGASLPGCRLRHHNELAAVADEIDALASGLGLEIGLVPAERRVEVIEKIVRALNAKLFEKLRELHPDGTLEFLVWQQERMQTDRTRLRLVVPNRSAVDDYVGDALKRFHEINQSALASRYVIEAAVHCVRDGNRPLSLSRYDELLAISEQMIGLGSRGEAYRYGLSDADMHFLEPGRLHIVTGDPFESTVSIHADASARALVDQDLLAEWASFNESKEPDPVFDLSEESAVFDAEYGVPLNGFIGAVERLSELAASTDGQVRTMPVPELIGDLASATQLSEPQAAKMLDMMSLVAEPDAAEPEVYDLASKPWRYSRDKSFLRRPILIRGSGPGESVATWGTQTSCTAVEALFDQMFSARLAASSPQMEKYISQQRNRIGRQFETEVANVFRSDPRNHVREQVKSLGNTSLKRDNGEKLGDIDVLVTNEYHKTLAIIEAKSFAATRSAQEIKAEVDKLFSGEAPAVDRHRERVNFVRDRWPRIHHQMRLPGQACDWQIHDMIVTSAPSIAADLLRRLGKEVGTKITSIEELQQTQARIDDQASA